MPGGLGCMLKPQKKQIQNSGSNANRNAHSKGSGNEKSYVGVQYLKRNEIKLYAGFTGTLDYPKDIGKTYVLAAYLTHTLTASPISHLAPTSQYRSLPRLISQVSDEGSYLLQNRDSPVPFPTVMD